MSPLQLFLGGVLYVAVLGSVQGCSSSSEKGSAESVATEWYSISRTIKPGRLHSIVGHEIANKAILEYPRYIVQTATQTLSLNLRGDSLVHVLSADGETYDYAFAKAGKGPGEFQTVWDYSHSNTSSEGLWLFDLASQRFTLWEPDNHANMKNSEVVEFVTTPNFSGRVLHAAELQDGSFAATGSFVGARIRKFGRNGVPLSDIGALPEPRKNESPAVIQHMYSSYITVRPGHNIVATAGVYVDQVDIYDFDSNRHVEVSGPYNIEPTYTRLDGRPVRTKESRLAFQSLASSSDYIVLLLSGKAPANMDNEDLAFYGQEILVLDWEGQMVGHVQTDRYLFSISVGRDGGSIYGLQHYPDVAWVRFDLSRLLNTAISN